MFEYRRLGDVVTLLNGRAYKQNELLKDGKYPVLRVGNFFSNRDWYYSNMELDDDKYCDNGDLLFAWSASFGPRIWDGGKAIYHYHIWKLVLSNEIWREYLYFYLLSVAERVKNEGHGITMIHTTKADMENRIIPIPNMSAQKQIAATLDKLQSVIAKRKQQLEKLDQLVKARFVEMFGDVKLNSKGWRVGTLSDFFEVKGGKRIPKGMSYSKEKTNHPYLRASDMKNETILDDDIHYISEEVYEYIKRYTVASGDIYLTNVGVNLGMAGVIPQKYDGANLTENAVKLVPKTNCFVGQFIAMYMNSPGIQELILERKMVVGVPKLAIFRIETMPLIIPPVEIQNEFLEFRNQIDKSKFAVQKALDEAQLLFDSLMQEYFG